MRIIYVASEIQTERLRGTRHELYRLTNFVTGNPVKEVRNNWLTDRAYFCSRTCLLVTLWWFSFVSQSTHFKPNRLTNYWGGGSPRTLQTRAEVRCHCCPPHFTLSGNVSQFPADYPSNSDTEPLGRAHQSSHVSVAVQSFVHQRGQVCRVKVTNISTLLWCASCKSQQHTHTRIFPAKWPTLNIDLWTVPKCIYEYFKSPLWRIFTCNARWYIYIYFILLAVIFNPFFFRVPPDLISLQLCSPNAVGV
jgi:hypothetical protein